MLPGTNNIILLTYLLRTHVKVCPNFGTVEFVFTKFLTVGSRIVLKFRFHKTEISNFNISVHGKKYIMRLKKFTFSINIFTNKKFYNIYCILTYTVVTKLKHISKLEMDIIKQKGLFETVRAETVLE